jgi:hypothetical protein
MRTTDKIFLVLLVYDYDAYPRSQFIEHEVTSVENAKVLKARLEKLMSDGCAKNRTGRWLDRHHGISGTVQRVDGLYRKTVTRFDI